MKDHKKNYWFKRRRYGWGWTPVTWQGFVVFFAGLAAILLSAYQLPSKPAHPTAAQLMTSTAIFVATVIIFIIIASLKSPTPHWRWGRRSDDNPDEDF